MKIPDNTTIVIFGASGDLTKRKLIPALFQLFLDSLLPKNFQIVGYARRKKSHDQFRAEMQEALLEFARSRPKVGTNELTNFISRLTYNTGNYDNKDNIEKLKIKLDKLDEEYRYSSRQG